MSLYYQDDTAALHHGDALEVAKTLEDGSVDCIVTSPPYYNLRDYGTSRQYGLEPTPEEYVENMCRVFSELRRVLADDGTLWLNLGDSYSKDKSLLGIPWRVALGLVGDGWVLRNSVVWHKPNAMPESVTDRLSGRHENVFLLTKGRNYWFDLDPIRESSSRSEAYVPGKWSAMARVHQGHRGSHANGRNPGDVWSISTSKFLEAHFATMPPALAERCVQSGCKPGGVVLDPFSGTGTSGFAAARFGRKFVGIDVNADYLDISLRTRLLEPGLNFGGGV